MKKIAIAEEMHDIAATSDPPTACGPAMIAERGERTSGMILTDVPWPELAGLVRATVLRIVGPSRELDDLTQTALERVVRGLDGFEGRAELRTFVYRIAVNVALNHWRWWRRWLRRFDPTAEASADAERMTTADTPHTTHDQLERARRLHTLLERLDSDQRIVLVLSDFEDFTGQEIADIVGCPEATVRSRLRRGRARLAELVLADDFFREELTS